MDRLFDILLTIGCIVGVAVCIAIIVNNLAFGF